MVKDMGSKGRYRCMYRWWVQSESSNKWWAEQLQLEHASEHAELGTDFRLNSTS